jgi:hypothetical protein
MNERFKTEQNIDKVLNHKILLAFILTPMDGVVSQ